MKCNQDLFETLFQTAQKPLVMECSQALEDGTAAVRIVAIFIAIRGRKFTECAECCSGIYRCYGV